MSVSETYLWRAESTDHAKPARRTVHSRSTSHLSIAIREGRSHIVINEVHTSAWNRLWFGCDRPMHSTWYLPWEASWRWGIMTDNFVWGSRMTKVSSRSNDCAFGLQWWHAYSHCRTRAPQLPSNALSRAPLSNAAQRPMRRFICLPDASASAATTVAAARTAAGKDGFSKAQERARPTAATSVAAASFSYAQRSLKLMTIARARKVYHYPGDNLCHGADDMICGMWLTVKCGMWFISSDQLT